MSVIEAFESGTFDLGEFYFTGDDYRYRFETEAKQRFIDMIHERFNLGATYKSRVLKWDTVIEQKVIELGRFLVKKSSALDFAEPAPRLERCDDRKLRTKILALTSSEARQLGIGRGTLHNLRSNARGAESFRIYRKVIARLQ
jgi:CRISPR-associated protein Cas1